MGRLESPFAYAKPQCCQISVRLRLSERNRIAFIIHTPANRPFAQTCRSDGRSFVSLTSRKSMTNFFFQISSGFRWPVLGENRVRAFRSRSLVTRYRPDRGFAQAFGSSIAGASCAISPSSRRRANLVSFASARLSPSVLQNRSPVIGEGRSSSNIRRFGFQTNEE